MPLRNVIVAFSAVLLIGSFALAQIQPSDSDADKEKKQKELDEKIIQMLDKDVVDASALVLPQNRAAIFAFAGDLYWKFDEKHARELFRNAAAEIVRSNQENEKEKHESADAYADLKEIDDTTDIRYEILPLVAKHDPEMALELLLQTRSAKLAESILRASQPTAKQATSIGFDSDRYRVREEAALEQQFALLAADENPDKAIKLIKDSLSNGISVNVLALLQKLAKKDDKKASELAGEVVKKLLDSDLSKNLDDMRATQNFLQYSLKPPVQGNTKDKPFTFSDVQIKDLATKLANTLMAPSRSLAFASTLSVAMPIFEKYLPDRVVLLRQRLSELQAGLPPELSTVLTQRRDPNASPEDILAQIPKMQNEYEKVYAYQAVARKIGEIDDDARAKKLIDQITDEKVKTNIQDQYETARISRAALAGKLEDARKMIGNVTNKKLQVQRLVQLAMEFQNKGGEKDLANAKSLMKEAKALTNESAETEDDIGDVMEVVKGYAVIDPDIAFNMFEPIVDRINDYTQASAMLARYQPRNSSFKKGEILMKVNSNESNLPFFEYVPQIQRLSKADLDRTNTVADRFARPDARAILKLLVLQGFLKDDKKPDTQLPTNGAGFYW